MKRSFLLLLFVLLITGFTVHGQSTDSELVTIDKLLDGTYNSQSYGPVFWASDDAFYTVIESNEIVRYDVQTNERTVIVPKNQLVPPGGSSPIRINRYSFTDNYSHVLLYTNVSSGDSGPAGGDYWVLDLQLWTWHKLGGDAPLHSLQNAQFSPDGKRVSYIKNFDIYTENLQSYTISRLTRDGSETIRNGRLKSAPASMVSRGFGSGRSGHIWNQESSKIAFVQSNLTGVPIYSIINYTNTLYPKVDTFPYTKVGQQLPSYRVGVTDLTGGDILWLNIPEDPHDSYVMQLEWLPGGDGLFMQILNREQNTMNMYVSDLDGNLSKIHTEATDHGWLEPYEVLWLDNGERFIFTSERNGWIQLFLFELSDRKIRNITPANFDVVYTYGIDQSTGWIYFIASPENPTQRYLYRVALDDPQSVEKVTPDSEAGTNSYNISSNFRWAIQQHSEMDSPPVYNLISLPDHKVHRVLEDNEELRDILGKIDRNSTDFFRVDIGNGIELDGFKITPPDFDPGKKYPLIYFVYGAPAAQMVLDQWSGSRHLWHLMLAQKGFLVMTFDNRGTPAPRGTSWRQTGYGYWPHLAADDQAAGNRKVLETFPYVDENNIGIYGHSGGGQMSLHVLFRYPELYHAAAPSSFLSHLGYYNAEYQERFSGLRDKNVEGYRLGSAVTWAHNLKGKLLIIDGTGDSNVHHQNFEALINELVSHNKEFSMMAYPNRGHGLGRALRSAVDENTQRHLYRLRLNFFIKHLQSGPK